MKINHIEDMQIWQNARELTVSVYKCFKDLKDFSFRDQIQRASISIVNNVAEGFERQTNKEFKNFLYIAKGSSGEVRSMLYIAFDLKYINQDEFEDLSKKVLIITKMISSLIKKI